MGKGAGMKEFLAEVNPIGYLHHFNLVKRIGFCDDGFQNGYMQNGYFEQNITGPYHYELIGFYACVCRIKSELAACVLTFI